MSSVNECAIAVTLQGLFSPIDPDGAAAATASAHDVTLDSSGELERILGCCKRIRAMTWSVSLFLDKG